MSENQELDEGDDLEEHDRRPERRGRDFESEGRNSPGPDSDPGDFYEERLR